MKCLLDVRDLTVQVPARNGPLTAIADVSFQVGVGETVCIVGESGSGKTITAKSIMRLVEDEGGTIASGRIELDGVDLVPLPAATMRSLRGKKVAMIFQEPMAAFDPVFPIGSQIVEAIVQHKRISRGQSWQQAVGLLQRVGIPEPELRMRQYPNEMSGGMLQRAMIAMALACEPELLIADEPTTALDMTIQAQILELLRELKQALGMSILLITHDLGIAAEMADRVIVMYAGRIVEQATVNELFRKPHHPYTQGLLASMAQADSMRKAKLHAIEGTIPSLSAMPAGCRFHPRCAYATGKCKADEPELIELHGRQAACWHTERLLEESAAAFARSGNVAAVRKYAEVGATAPVLWEIDSVSRLYPIRKGLRSQSFIRAVDDVSFHIRQGETFGLVGESGSGKSTLGRTLLQLERATAGRVLFRGRDLTSMDNGALREVRKDMQMIFQDAYSSMNPRWKIKDIIGEPLRVHERIGAKEKQERIEQLLETVGLSRTWHDRYPHEFSGGQRQRIGIARALALNPSFVLADEAVSALDVSVQAQIVNLLQQLQESQGLTYLFIGHGLPVVRHMSDRIGVMYLGKLVETASSDELFRHPAHHYTKALLASIPLPDPTLRSKRNPVVGEIPSPTKPPSGCRFHTRCPAATSRCREEQPGWTEIGKDHFAACHYPL